MKAYKCNLCKKYCNDVYTIHGISEPYIHRTLPNGSQSVDCCETCYDKIMVVVAGLMGVHPYAL
jgi:hypothetical protein